MDPKPFKPSIDWSRALPDSLLWSAKAWLISAVVILIVLVLIRYLTVWAGNTGGSPVRTSPVGGPCRCWLMFGVLLLSVILSVRLNVLFSYQSNDLYTALQDGVRRHRGR